MLYLIDGNPLLYRAADRIAASVPADSAGGYVVRETVGIVGDMLRRHGNGEILFFLDGGRGFRKKMYPEYKAHRDAEPDPLREKVRTASRTFTQILDELNGSYIRVPDVEADDLISIVAAKCRTTATEAFIVTEDRDLDQALGDGVRALRLREERVVDRETALRDWQGDPVRFCVWKALAGDSGDNIKVFDGIGPERAHELVMYCGAAVHKLFGAEAKKLWGAKKWFAKSLGLPDASERMQLALRLVVTATDFEDLCPPQYAKTGQWFVPEQCRGAVETALRRLKSPPMAASEDAVVRVRRLYDAHWLTHDLAALAPFAVAPPPVVAIGDPFAGAPLQPFRGGHAPPSGVATGPF